MSDVGMNIEDMNTKESLMLAQGGVCAHEGHVLISHPRIWPEYMVFTPQKARELADMLLKYAAEAEGKVEPGTELTVWEKLELYKNAGMDETTAYKAVIAAQQLKIRKMSEAGLCLAAENAILALAIPPEKRASLRPRDYNHLSQEEQWEIDKRLGILDWDGQATE